MSLENRRGRSKFDTTSALTSNLLAKNTDGMQENLALASLKQGQTDFDLAHTIWMLQFIIKQKYKDIWINIWTDIIQTYR